MPTLVIGLGNFGGGYANTRHNVGWQCLDEVMHRGKFGRQKRLGPALIQEGELEGIDVVLAWPQTYMNESGKAGKYLLRHFSMPVTEIIVVHDDIDLPFGRLRIRRGGSAGGQRGVQSLINDLGTQDFIRVRIGVGRPPEGSDAVDHVLRSFSREERKALPEILTRAAESVISLLQNGLEKTMADYNRASVS